MADKKSTVALCLPRAPHLRRFSSQAAPGKNLGDSPPRVSNSFALDWNATFNRALRRAWLASSPADPKSRRARQDGVRRSGHAPRHNLPNCLDDQAGDRDCGHDARRGRPAQTRRPVDRLLPALANRGVLRRIDAALDDTGAGQAADYRRGSADLSLWTRADSGAARTLSDSEGDRRSRHLRSPDRALPLEGDAWMQRLSGLPLLAQPGEDWLYGTGSNIQGVLVARASGQSCRAFAKSESFGRRG
jgi:hypothetical protein